MCERREQLGGSAAFTADLRQAIERDELVLHYQPKIDFSCGRVVGVEALVRWQHPRLGLLSPARFLPAAIESGLIDDLTSWVVSRALTLCRRWLDDGIERTVAVNVSARSLRDPGFPDRLAAALEEADVPPDRLILEITESELIENREQTMCVLDAVDAMGIGLSVDDFGTGYSSLAYLRQLPVKEIKIDRSFTAGMADNVEDAVIVRSIVDLSRNLGLRVVVEGIEDRETLDRVLELTRCDHVQGYHICHPLPAPELEAWLSQTSWVTASPRPLSLHQVATGMPPSRAER